MLPSPVVTAMAPPRPTRRLDILGVFWLLMLIGMAALVYQQGELVVALLPKMHRTSGAYAHRMHSAAQTQVDAGQRFLVEVVGFRGIGP